MSAPAMVHEISGRMPLGIGGSIIMDLLPLWSALMVSFRIALDPAAALATAAAKTLPASLPSPYRIFATFRHARRPARTANPNATWMLI